MPPASVVRLPGLRALRLKSLMTQEQLATKAGIARVTLARIEAGGPTKLPTAAALARALGVRARDMTVLPADPDEQ
jgi:transcriptional regulator with XRE-family HTH domain